MDFTFYYFPGYTLCFLIASRVSFRICARPWTRRLLMYAEPTTTHKAKEVTSVCKFSDFAHSLRNKHKSLKLIRRVSGFLLCPGSDLNRYDRCGSQDFKSCVSTNSTTRANGLKVQIKMMHFLFQKKSSALGGC